MSASIINLNPRKHRFDLAEIKSRLKYRIDGLVRELYGDDAKSHHNEWRIADILGGKGTSCAIARNGDKAGLWYDHNPSAAHKSGDAIDMIAYGRGLSIKDAIHWAARFVGLDSGPTRETLSNAGIWKQPATKATPLPASDPKPASLQNLTRRSRKLFRNRKAIDYLLNRGLTQETIKRFHLGLSEPYFSKLTNQTVENALGYPLISRSGDPLGRFFYYKIPDVTLNPTSDNGWGAGSPVTYWSKATDGKRSVFVAEGAKDVWILAQKIEETELDKKMVVMTSSHGAGCPRDWQKRDFWSEFDTIYAGQDSDESGAGDQMAERLAGYVGKKIRRVRVPSDMGKDWTDFFKSGGSIEAFEKLLKEAPLIGDVSESEIEDKKEDYHSLGIHAANPININGAYVNGYLYYPFMVENREMEEVQDENGMWMTQTVFSYQTQVVRSDGAVLSIETLPAPKGVLKEDKVLALTDGTRIESRPNPRYYSTWRLSSIKRFIKSIRQDKETPHRPLKDLLNDVRRYLQKSVWLPYPENYTLLSAYVAMSFVYQVFEAIPLILLFGAKGTGKTELGNAIADLSFNAMVIGQGSAASIVRLVNESRGLLVLDDLESIGSVIEGDFGDLNQMLKLSYKKSTARKPITDKHGRVNMFDFYGPKIINNTQGADAILMSRMFRIITRQMPEAVRMEGLITGNDPDSGNRLRQELHTWGMSSARHIYDIYHSIITEKSERQEEISAPLRAIAKASGDYEIMDTLDTAIERQQYIRFNDDDPVELLKEAVKNCVLKGAVRRVTSFQILLEMATIMEPNTGKEWVNQIPVWKNPVWIGKQISLLEIKDNHKTKTRRRLYGIVTNIYDLNREYVKEITENSGQAADISPEQTDPMDFCTKQNCRDCAYEVICEDIIPDLRTNKAARKQTQT